MKIFGITLGDPCGIGIEVTIKALLKEPSYQKEALLFGPLSVLEYYNKRLKANFTFNVIETIEEFKMGMINVVDPHPVKLEDVLIGKVSALGGEVAFEAVRTAIEFARRKEISSVITAPLNKKRFIWRDTGLPATRKSSPTTPKGIPTQCSSPVPS